MNLHFRKLQSIIMEDKWKKWEMKATMQIIHTQWVKRFTKMCKRSLCMIHIKYSLQRGRPWLILSQYVNYPCLQTGTDLTWPLLHSCSHPSDRVSVIVLIQQYSHSEHNCCQAAVTLLPALNHKHAAVTQYLTYQSAGWDCVRVRLRGRKEGAQQGR